MAFSDFIFHIVFGTGSFVLGLTSVLLGAMFSTYINPHIG